MEVAMRKSVPVLMLLLLVGCAKKSEDVAAAHEPAPPAAAEAAAPPGDQHAAKDAATTTDKPTQKQPVSAPLISVPQLAYVFAYTFALPADRIEQTMDRDQRACLDAGPSVCQLVGANLDRASEGVASARLEVRAIAPWITHFRAGAEAEAKAAGGKLDGARVESEDLSRSLVDTEAAIRAKTALRDRLERLAADRGGKLADVMDVQHELTAAQADLDATTSELAVMRTRVAMSKLTVTYNAAGMGAPNGPWSPLRAAFHGFLGNAAGVLAVLVEVASVLLPLGLAAAPLGWLAIRLANRRRPGRTAPAA
jgi:hypothetical protein